MRAIKLILIWVYSVCALFCVRYAHSEEIRYATPKLSLPYCELNISKEDGLMIFTPSAASESVFFGFTPDEEGDVEMMSSQLAEQKPFFSVGELQYDEILTVTFGEVEGQMQPVSYRYVKPSGLNLERTFQCKGLSRINLGI